MGFFLSVSLHLITSASQRAALQMKAEASGSLPRGLALLSLAVPNSSKPRNKSQTAAHSLTLVSPPLEPLEPFGFLVASLR